MTNKNDTNRTIAQITLNYYEANTLAHEARQSLEIACNNWLSANGLQTKPERGTPEWEQMCAATELEHAHLQRTVTRKKNVHAQLMRKAAAALGVHSRRWSTPAAGETKRKLALIELQQKITDPEHQRALDKRRLCAALADVGVSRSVALQVCRDFFGSRESNSHTTA